MVKHGRNKFSVFHSTIHSMLSSHWCPWFINAVSVFLSFPHSSHASPIPLYHLFTELIFNKISLVLKTLSLCQGKTRFPSQLYFIWRIYPWTKIHFQCQGLHASQDQFWRACICELVSGQESTVIPVACAHSSSNAWQSTLLGNF